MVSGSQVLVHPVLRILAPASAPASTVLPGPADRSSVEEGAAVSLGVEILLVSGVALDLVGAGVLSHAHNAESIVEIREEIGEEGSAVGEDDALSTHAQLLAEKRIGFLLLTVGLVLYLTGLVLKSSEDAVTIGLVAVGVVLGALATSLVFTRVAAGRIREQALRAEDPDDPAEMPEQ
jgi:hypothetical protein